MVVFHKYVNLIEAQIIMSVIEANKGGQVISIHPSTDSRYRYEIWARASSLIMIGDIEKRIEAAFKQYKETGEYTP